MTTIIIHGTIGKGANWYWNSFHRSGFCEALKQGMWEADEERPHDIWMVNGEHVSEVERLQQEAWDKWKGMPKDFASVDGRYEWTGAPEGLARGAAAIWLVKYLNRLREITDEPIRVIAHSHGCNVVKLASSLKELNRNVYIEKAIFIACPHFYEKKYEVEKPKSWMDNFDIKKQIAKEAGVLFRYKVDPDHMGRILNIYTEKDSVQVDIADTWSGTYAPQTGSFWENLGKMLKTLDVYERPEASRTDLDPDVARLYEDLEVQVRPECGGIQAHSILHGAHLGRLMGQWLNSTDHISNVIKNFGEPAIIPCDDLGE